MKKLSLLLLVFLTPGLLLADALHQWTGSGQIEGQVFDLKLVILEDHNFVVLVQSPEAPFAVEGTWESEDGKTLSLTVTTEKIMDEEIPIQKGTLFIMDEKNALIVAEGFGIELEREMPAGADSDAGTTGKTASAGE